MAVAAVGVFALAVTLVPAPAALAHGAKKSKSVVVVQVVDRAPYGEMLATTTGLSLYTGPPCTGSCLGIWPPLLMPKGKKVTSRGEWPWDRQGEGGQAQGCSGHIQRSASLHVLHRHR
jgi:hypothetical protein